MHDEKKDDQPSAFSSPEAFGAAIERVQADFRKRNPPTEKFKARGCVDAVDRARLERALHVYEELCDALRDVLEDGWPSQEELADAPMIDAWRFGTRTVPCLEGVSSSHPDLPDGDPVRTSRLALLNIEAGIARTESRWYRLGERRPQDDLTDIATRVRVG